MRLLISVAIVAFYAAITSTASANQSVADAPFVPAKSAFASSSKVRAEKRKVSFNISDEIERELGTEILTSAANFSTRLLANWRNFERSWALSPSKLFFYVATFPYGPQTEKRRAIMTRLGLADVDPRELELDLQALTDTVNNYMTVKPSNRTRTAFTCKPTFKVHDRIRESVSNFMHKRPRLRFSEQWDIRFDALRKTRLSPFHPYKKLNSDNKAKFMRIILRARYGRFMDSKFVVFASNRDTSLLVILPNDEEAFEKWKSQLGVVNFQDLRANSLKRLVDVSLPKFTAKTELQSWMWALDIFGSENPFSPFQYHQGKNATRGDFESVDFDRKYSVHVGRNHDKGSFDLSTRVLSHLWHQPNKRVPH